MIHEIRPIVYEDPDPEKIRRALRRGIGAVIVPADIPPALITEAAALTQPPLADLSALYRAPEQPGQPCQWNGEEARLKETQNWLREKFEWAARAGLCRKPENAHGRLGLIRVWANAAQNLPWHYDRELSPVYPDMHLHLAGAGMVVAHVPHLMNMRFTENKSSPFLILPEDPRTINPRSVLTPDHQQKIENYLAAKGVALKPLQPGEMLFFNQHCLHASAGATAAKLRAAIF
ncbi:MAG TPA: hypothetical protein VGD95_01165 [Micavibrio sp.]